MLNETFTNKSIILDNAVRDTKRKRERRYLRKIIINSINLLYKTTEILTN